MLAPATAQGCREVENRWRQTAWRISSREVLYSPPSRRKGCVGSMHGSSLPRSFQAPRRIVNCSRGQDYWTAALQRSDSSASESAKSASKAFATQRIGHALATRSDALQPQSIALRAHLDALRTQSIALQAHPNALGARSIAVQAHSNTLRPQSIAIRAQSNALQPQSFAFPAQSNSLRTQSIALPSQSNALLAQAIALAARSNPRPSACDSSRSGRGYSPPIQDRPLP